MPHICRPIAGVYYFSQLLNHCGCRNKLCRHAPGGHPAYITGAAEWVGWGACGIYWYTPNPPGLPAPSNSYMEKSSDREINNL